MIRDRAMVVGTAIDDRAMEVAGAAVIDVDMTKINTGAA